MAKTPCEYEEANNKHYDYVSTYQISSGQGIDIYKRGNMGIIVFGNACKPTPANTSATVVSGIDNEYLPIISQYAEIREPNNNVYVSIGITTNGTITFYARGATSSNFNIGGKSITYMIKD